MFVNITSKGAEATSKTTGLPVRRNSASVEAGDSLFNRVEIRGWDGEKGGQGIELVRSPLHRGHYYIGCVNYHIPECKFTQPIVFEADVSDQAFLQSNFQAAFSSFILQSHSQILSVPA